MDFLKTNGLAGLTAEQARERLAAEGYNELPQEKRQGFLSVAKSVIKEPMLALLLACVSIYLVLGDRQEALVLLGSILLIIAITIFQENKTEKALAALKSLSSPRALVWRDSQYQKIPGREVVRGDIILLNEGDRVPADGVVLENNNLMVDESLLTGESLAVKKITGQAKDALDKPGGRESAFVYSGTLVISGQAVFFVKTTGLSTEMGRIGGLLGGIEEEKTPLQKDFTRAVKVIFYISLFLCLSALVLTGLSSGNWLAGFLAGLTLAMAILPEEFPVVLAIFTSIGAWRLSKRKILVRHLSAVENLGAATVLCVDKTGTLTMNEMEIQEIMPFKEETIMIAAATKQADDKIRSLIKMAAWASRRETFDPLEKAIRKMRRKFCRGENIYRGLTYRQEYPLSAGLFAVAHAWEKKDGRSVAYSKGAPEAMAELCHLSEKVKHDLEEQTKQMAGRGLRLLGLAQVEFSGALPENIRDFKWKFVGLLGFHDPVRPGVAEAIQECYDAGIAVKVITGDYQETGLNIAQQVGLRNSQEALTGFDLERLAAASLPEEIKRIDVFARMIPENKLQIIRALKSAGELVAMTGDGVNDGPALKAADIGVAMGKRGTDVARETSDIVLMNDDFPSLVKGIKEGRRIFDNLKRVAVYLVAIHIPIAGMVFIPLLLGWPILFFPVHIMFMELIFDPICSVVFEAEGADKNIMKRPPRRIGQSILNKHTLLVAGIQGATVLAITVLVYKYVLTAGWTESAARTVTFATLIFANLLLVLANRSWSLGFFQSFFKKNKVLWPVIAAAFLFLGLVIYIPALQNMFGFVGLNGKVLASSFGAAAISVLVFEILKFWQRKKIA
jgi:Ca2+-transporting ATPase